MYTNSLVNVDSLREAYIDIYSDGADPEFPPVLESWLEALRHVEVLELSHNCVEA